MSHRWIRLLVFAGCAIFGMLAAARAQTTQGSLKPHTQTISPTAVGAGTRNGLVTIPDGVTPEARTGTAETAPTPAPDAFTYLMLRWRATATAEEQVRLEVRASDDGHNWTAWGAVHENEDLVDPGEDSEVHWSSTIYTGPARFWQVRTTLTAAADGSLPVLHAITVHTIDSRGEEPTPAAPEGRQLSAANGQPGFVSRASWGGSEVLNNSVAPTWYRADHLVLHHTAGANSLRPGETTWADRVRAEWSFHTYSRGWGDVGYNWLVSPNGVIYEGRNGSANTEQDSVGFHDTANKGSMGVVMLGTFGPGVTNVEPIVPTDAAQDAVVRLFAWKAGQRGIDPMARSFYYGCSVSSYCAPYNSGAIIPNIAGHRQVTPRTSCPGDLAMGIIDSIRTRVRDALGAAPPPAPPPPPSNARAELVHVEYLGSPVEAGGIAQVRFTVRNTGSVVIGSQEPRAGHTDNIAPGHVYDEGECFLGNADQSYAAFPKENGRLRVVLGGSEGETALGTDCAANAGGYPWRWGIGDALQPGETRTVVGYVRFRNRTNSSRTITLRPALVNEFVEYYPTSIGPTTITVAPERRPPVVGASDENGKPLASVYRLAPTPDNVLARSLDPVSIKEGDLLGTFAWDGAELRWGAGGPAGQADRFIVLQARPFVAPQAGTYTFEITSDEGSWLWIDGQLVVSNSGLHAAESVSGSKYLAAGPHVLAIKYFEYTGAASARYSWITPGTNNFTTIPVASSLNAPQRGMVYGPGDQAMLVADDLGGLGTDMIQYSINGGPDQTRTGALMALGLGNGDNWVVYRAVDKAGTRSPDRRMLVRVDAIAPRTTLGASTRSDGAIALEWESSPDASLFEIQSQEAGTERWMPAGQFTGRSATYLGTPGRNYQFKVRGWDGLNWEAFTYAITPAQSVPSSARLQLVHLPVVWR